MSTESQDSFLSFRSQLTFEAEVIVVLAPEFLRLAVKRLQIRDAAMFPLLQNYLLRLRNETSRLLFFADAHIPLRPRAQQKSSYLNINI